jgi:hypothetical protein
VNQQSQLLEILNRIAGPARDLWVKYVTYVNDDLMMSMYQILAWLVFLTALITVCITVFTRGWRRYRNASGYSSQDTAELMMGFSALIGVILILIWAVLLTSLFTTVVELRNVEAVALQRLVTSSNK